MVLYSWAKLLCRISCVESAMRLPVLWCWMWRGGGGWRSREGRGREAEADCTPCCCQWWPLWLLHARRSPSQTLSKSNAATQRKWKSLFLSSLLFFFSPPATSVIIRILHNHRVGAKLLSGTVRYEVRSDIFVPNVSFLCNYRTCPSVC